MSFVHRLVAAAVILAAASCGTDAVGTDACRKIEQARCRRAPQCPALLLQSNGVEECNQFARDHCLHGLPVADPGAPAVDSCVGAIDRATCDVVAHPETTPECAFLQPSPALDAGPGEVDAPSDTSAPSDASAEGESSTAEVD
jgi:hypothetical protein